MRRLTAALVSVLALSILLTQPASGSGDPGPSTIFIDRHSGNPAERARLYRGRMGVLLPSSPDGLLYLQWRLLNGLTVGDSSGAALNASCCDIASYGGDPNRGIPGWSKATALVPGGQHAPGWIATELPGPDYTRIPNCFDDAFDVAAATLKDRVARYGANHPAVAAWLETQNAVFDACSKADALLPAPMPAAPKWLKADRAYQEAAFALYKGQNEDAFRRFQAIAHDRTSPWQAKGPYLAARARQRVAFNHPSPQAFAAARAAIAQLRAQPNAYGFGEVRGMVRALAYRDQPDLLFKRLDDELHAPAPVPDLPKGLRDYTTLSARYTPRPDLADWLGTLDSNDREPAAAHATERWTATRKPHWLIAALALARAGDASSADLVSAGATVPKSSPAWLTVQYHLIRLTFTTGDPADLRNRVDAILAADLSGSDRNLFLALRTQLAINLADMMRFALRQPFCSEAGENCQKAEWVRTDSTLAKTGSDGSVVAIGPEAKALLDRLPLRTRMAAGAGLPRELRLDLALTNYGRAVQLQNNQAIDRLADELVDLMPALRGDWQTIRRTRPGPSKRFAELLVLAKIPGLAPDFADYVRPQGTVRQWQGPWLDWMIIPRAAASPVQPPSAGRYNPWGWYGADDKDVDLVCFSNCGDVTFPLRLPAFAASLRVKAQSERDRLIFYNDQSKTILTKGSVSAWTSLLDYARANPRDPRSPEALYWLIRISHWGHAHDRVGYNAFRLLHTRYRGSVWARRSPYYYD